MRPTSRAATGRRLLSPILVLLRMGFTRPVCYHTAGELLPHHFNLTTQRKIARSAECFCCTFPIVTYAGRYPASLPCGARTFLIDLLDPRDRLLYPKNNALIKDCTHKRDAVCNHDCRDQKDHSNLNHSFFCLFIHQNPSPLSDLLPAEDVPRQSVSLIFCRETNGFRLTCEIKSCRASSSSKQARSRTAMFSQKIASVA